MKKDWNKKCGKRTENKEEVQEKSKGNKRGGGKTVKIWDRNIKCGAEKIWKWNQWVGKVEKE